MSLSAVIQALDLLAAATVNGQVVADAIRAAGVPEVEVQRFTGQQGRPSGRASTPPTGPSDLPARPHRSRSRSAE